MLWNSDRKEEFYTAWRQMWMVSLCDSAWLGKIWAIWCRFMRGDGLPVDEGCHPWFIHHEMWRKDTAAYFELYRKVQDDYGITDITCRQDKTQRHCKDLHWQLVDEKTESVIQSFAGWSVCIFVSAGKEKITDNWYEFLKNIKDIWKRGEAPADCYQACPGRKWQW